MNDSTTYSESEQLKDDKEKAVDSKLKLSDPGQEIETIPETAPLPPPEESETLEEEPQGIIQIANRAAKEKSQEPQIMVAKKCDLGAVRERNEDSCFVFAAETGGHFSTINFGLYIVADGMGGHSNGHVASNIATLVAARYVLNKIYMPLLQTSEHVNQAPIQEVLVNAIQAANIAVYESDPESDSGTTLTLALIFGRRLHVAHVGDSRLYLHTEERLEAITSDHSLVQRLQDVGQLTSEEAAQYRYRNVLLRAVGQGEEVEVDTYMRLLPKKGKLLLCSDGLCGFVTDEDIDDVMNQEVSIKKMADDLYDTAMAAGGYDNITAVIVDFSF